MNPEQNMRISYAFGRLHGLADSFSELRGARPRSALEEKRALRLAKELGSTAVPLLFRRLRSGSLDEASWAYRLAVHIGSARVTDEARILVADSTVPDDKKAFGLALLSELGAADHPLGIKNPRALREGSVLQLLARLDSPADIARAADILMSHVPRAEIGSFVVDMAEIAGAKARPIIDELLLRDDLTPESIDVLREEARNLSNPPRTRRTRRPPRIVYVGERSDGRRAVLVFEQSKGPTTVPLRGLVIHIEKSGQLGLVRYDAALDTSVGKKRILAALVRVGFALSPCTPKEAAGIVANAARSSLAFRARLPREYYLGRDLLDLYDEHLPPPAKRKSRRAQSVALADELIKRKQFTLARARLEESVASHPNDAHVNANLGLCMLELGDADEALARLARAARLAPKRARYHWNLAQAARQANRLGACYLALSAYLRTRDREDGAKTRVLEAERFIALFERLSRREHPETAPERVARAEELFERAYRNLASDRAEEAISGFEAVLKLVPSHYPSWGNLGAAYVKLMRKSDAEYCLRQALKYRPDYELAQKNLSVLFP